MGQKILLIQDDPCFGSVLKSYLQLSNYDVTFCLSGEESLKACRRERFDLCLLDVVLPEMDGFTLGRSIRELAPPVPFIYVTTKGEKSAVLEGYEVGAADYIIKPFDTEVLVLKIKAILGRREPEKKSGEFQIGNYLYNTELRTIEKGDYFVKLTPKENRLLKLLYQNRDGLLMREHALFEIWGAQDYYAARSMDVFISKLRKYFKDDTDIRIENVHGSGFRLVVAQG